MSRAVPKKAAGGSANPQRRGRANQLDPTRVGRTDSARGAAETTTAAGRIGAARAARGWSQSLLARLLARDGGTAGAWQQRLSEYETGLTEPDPATLARVLETLSADPAGQARDALDQVLGGHVPRLVREHGSAAVSEALGRLALFVRGLA